VTPGVDAGITVLDPTKHKLQVASSQSRAVESHRMISTPQEQLRIKEGPTKFEELFHNNQPDQEPSTSTYKYWIPQSRQEEIPGVREGIPGVNEGTMTSAAQ
jgi:hypothetical protein